MTADGRERFLAAIAERIPPERIAEVHLFPPMRQGGRETGVAVITVRIDEEPVADDGVDLAPEAAGAPGEALEPATLDEALGIDAAREALAGAAPDEGESPESATPAARQPLRFTVYRASYRLTLKGPDRGKWEVIVTEEGDAPAYTVDEVVRGVHERAGGEDEPERLSGEAFRAALAGEPWPARG